MCIKEINQSKLKKTKFELNRVDNLCKNQGEDQHLRPAVHENSSKHTAKIKEHGSLHLISADDLTTENPIITSNNRSEFYLFLIILIH